MSKPIRSKKCADCGRRNKTVKRVNDPYIEEVHKEIKRINLCTKCYNQHCYEV